MAFFIAPGYDAGVFVFFDRKRGIILRSMTGFGSAMTRRDGYVVTSEIKSVNSRYLKTACRVSDGFSSFEQPIENLLHSEIERGTVNVAVEIHPETRQKSFSVTPAVIDYIEEGLKIRDQLAMKGIEIPLGTIADYLRLPGTIVDSSADAASECEKVWPLVEENLREAIRVFNGMRDAEGESMEANLHSLCQSLTALVAQVEEYAPGVVQAYRSRLQERIGKILEPYSQEIQPSDIIREVALFTDKADISEETVRFRSHLAQFDAAMNMSEPCGKRLDFLTQEMFREVNTIGSKANESAITNLVVAMKTQIEKVREMVQNVE